MSDEEFLARWSRRKHEERAGAKPDVEVPAPSDLRGAAERRPTPVAGEADAEPKPDLASLPPIDSITAATDITVFLRKGIPQELAHAALRRAWSADPAIRDFVGLAESAWDFNDPNAMHGFGPLDLSETDLAALIERVVGDVRTAAEELDNVVTQSEKSAPAQDSERELTPAAAKTGRHPIDPVTTSEVPTASVAVQPTAAEGAGDEETLRRRTHGGALPR